MRIRRLTSLIALPLLLATACGGEDVATEGDAATTTAPETTTTEQTATTAAETTTTAAAETTTTPATAEGLTVAQTSLGSVLADAEGNVLYLFIPDAQGDPTCLEECALNWPPYTGPAEAGEGVDASLVGTAQHPEESDAQITFNGWPLYYFAGDAAPGDVNGQGVNDVWFAVSPEGEPVEAAAGSYGYDY